MISTETLHRLLVESAEAYQVPDGGPASIIRAADLRRRKTLVPRVARRHPRMLLAAAGGTVLVAVAASVGGLASTRAPVASQPGGVLFAGRVPAVARAAAGGSNPSRTAAASGAGGSVAQPVAPAPAAGTAVAPGPDSARIVQTASLSLSVGKGRVGPALDRLENLAAGEGGYVATSQQSSGSGGQTGEVALRVPVARFTATLNQVATLGTVTASQTSGRDVTGQYTDLAARIHALQVSRSTYLTLLTRASTIGDVLAVQQQVDGVQTQIEQLTGQLAVLADESSLASVTVDVAEQGSPAAFGPPVQRSGLAKAWHAAVGGFTHGVEWIISGAGTALLLGLCALVLLAIAGPLRRVLRRRLV